MSENDVILESHESRLQHYEDFSSEVSATMAELREQIKGVIVRIDAVGREMHDDVSALRGENDSDHADLKRELAALKNKQDEQGQHINILLVNYQAARKRMGLMKKICVTTVIALLGAVAAKWGARWGEIVVAWFGR